MNMNECYPQQKDWRGAEDSLAGHPSCCPRLATVGRPPAIPAGLSKAQGLGLADRTEHMCGVENALRNERVNSCGICITSILPH